MIILFSNNVNIVIPGRVTPGVPQNGVVQCKKDSSTDGKRVCTTLKGN